MPVIPIGFGQVNLFFSGSALPTGAQCTFGVDVSGGSDDPTTDAETIADIWATVGVGTNLSNNVDLVKVAMKYGPSTTGPSGEFNVTEEGAGGTSSAPNTAWIVTKNTSAGGRAGRGRLFLPGVPEDEVTEAGAINSGPVAALQADLNSFHGELITASLPMVLLHGEGSPISTPSPVTSLSVQNLVATQRRRLRR